MTHIEMLEEMHKDKMDEYLNLKYHYDTDEMKPYMQKLEHEIRLVSELIKNELSRI